MSVRTIEHAGTWWNEGADGIWRRWSHVFGDWEPIEGLPPGMEAAPIDPIGVPVAFPPTAAERELDLGPVPVAREYLGTLFRLTLPALLLGLALPVLFLLSLLFLFLSREALPPPHNVQAIVVFSAVAGALVAGGITIARHLPDRRWAGPARGALAAVVTAVAIPIGWMATGADWSGSEASKATTLAAVLLLGLVIDGLHRRGALGWLRPGDRRDARRSPFAGPG